MKIKILIVEDEAILAMTYQMALTKRNYLITDIVYTGEDAIKVVVKNKPDLIIMDIKLQGVMSGIDAAMKINEDYGIPLIYITGNSDKQTRNRALEANPIGYLEKPLDFEKLYEIIEQTLS